MKNKSSSKLSRSLVLILIIFIFLGPFYFIYMKSALNNEIKVKKQETFKGVISFWDYPKKNISTGSSYGWILEKIKKFEKENPGVFIEFKALSPKTGHILLDTAVDTNTCPDIGPVATDMRIISKGILEDMGEFFTNDELSKYRKDALKAVTYEGKIWALPYSISTYNLILNVDLFNERGVELPVDRNWTYKEFVDKLKELTDYEHKGKKVQSYGFNSYIGVNDYSIWGILLSDGGEIFDESGNYFFNDERALNGVTKLVDLKNKYKVVPPNFGEQTENLAWKSFFKDKKVAVYPAGTWAVSALTRAYEMGEGFEFDVVNYPKGSIDKPLSVAKVVSSYGIFKQEDLAKRQMCMKFLKFLSKDEYQRDLYKVGAFPVKINIEDIYSGNEKMSFIENQLKNSKVISKPSWNITQEYFYSQLRQIILKNKPIKKALEDASTKINAYRNIKKE